MKKTDVIFGIHPVVEAIKSGKEIDKILIQKDLRNSAIAELIKLANGNSIPFQHVPVEKINRITTKNHQGVLCFMSPISYYDIDQILAMTYDKGELPLVLVLDRITDVRNFGAIARTAECAGVHAIIIPTKNAAQINADAIKTSSGAIHNVHICRVNSLTSTIKLLQSNGLQIVACTEKTDTQIYDVDYTTPTAIVVGSEEDGISIEILAKTEHSVKIPLFGQTSSLNASVATAIILYEAVRQRTSL